MPTPSEHVDAITAGVRWAADRTVRRCPRVVGVHAPAFVERSRGGRVVSSKQMFEVALKHPDPSAPAGAVGHDSRRVVNQVHVRQSACEPVVAEGRLDAVAAKPRAEV